MSRLQMMKKPLGQPQIKNVVNVVKKVHEWWMEQTRASDEPPTRFYECTECGNVHKEYD